MNYEEAMIHVVDAARQHRDTMRETGGIEGVVDLLTAAIRIVEAGPLVPYMPQPGAPAWAYPDVAT